jgi:hypothetical protein
MRTSLLSVLRVAILFFTCFCSNTNMVHASSSSRRSTTITNVVAQELTRNSKVENDDVKAKSTTTMERLKDNNNSDEIDSDVDTIKIVFSDVDGTLLHYPSLDHSDGKGSNNNNNNDETDGSIATDDASNEILRLPPSSTGLVGIISSRTLQQCQEIRRGAQHGGCKLVLVSGMRTSTLLQRLPFLPKADAYCSEAGGRIFYPTTPPPPPTAAHADDNAITTLSSMTVTPKPFSGATASDLEPYGLVEDLEWKRRMERLDAAGPVGDDDSNSALEDRPGAALWEFARDLQRRGLVVDTKGYSTCFRVNRIHNDENSVFDNVLLAGKIAIPKQLASSTNLGCVDFYPAASGKRNWYVTPLSFVCLGMQSHCSISQCSPLSFYPVDDFSCYSCEYVALKFLSTIDGATSSVSSSSTMISSSGALLLAKHAVCLCDDDNDLEMALACQHAYIPGISSKSMAETIGKNPNRFTVTTLSHSLSFADTNTKTTPLIPAVQEGTTSATEAALSLVLKRIQST